MRYDLDDRGEFAKHYQEAWLKRAEDTLAPNWLRVVCLAYGLHGINGHSPFRRGRLASMLGPPGEPLPRQRVCDAINTAVDRGWLAYGSSSMCLQVPDHAIEKGRPDAKREPCHVCRRRAARKAERDQMSA